MGKGSKWRTQFDFKKYYDNIELIDFKKNQSKVKSVKDIKVNKKRYTY